MKLKSIAIACGVAAAGVASQASAQAVGAFDAPQIKVFLSGATAPDNFLQSIATGLFDAGFNVYQDDNGTPANFADDGRLFRAFFGRFKNDASIPQALRGKTGMFIKRSKGGSVWGVNPVARAERVATLNITAATCVLNGGIHRCAEKGIDPGLPDYLNVSNAGEVPDFGVSDVEPAMFKGPYNVEFGQSELSASEVGRLEVSAANVLMMGISATNAVPETTYISRADYAGMLSGTVQDWTQLDPNLTGNTQVVVCRRVQGSGTQTSYNWFFNNFPCESGFNGTIAPSRMVQNSASGIVGGDGSAAAPFLIDPTAGYTVVENSTSGNVRDCLRNAQNHADHTFTGDDGKRYTIKFSNSTEAFRAIGVLSLDSFTSANPNNNGWSFRNLDGAGVFNANNQTDVTANATGIRPSKANLIEGRYDFAVELALQYRKVAVVNPHGDNVAALSGDKLTLVKEFVKRAGDPAFQTNATAALPVNYNHLDNPAQIAKGTRYANTCSPLQKLF